VQRSFTQFETGFFFEPGYHTTLKKYQTCNPTEAEECSQLEGKLLNYFMFIELVVPFLHSANYMRSLDIFEMFR
jgi:hypothetical protein